MIVACGQRLSMIDHIFIFFVDLLQYEIEVCESMASCHKRHLLDTTRRLLEWALFSIMTAFAQRLLEGWCLLEARLLLEEIQYTVFRSSVRSHSHYD